MLPLPHGRWLLAIGWILILTVIVASLTPHLPAAVGKVNDKIQHFSCYLLLMLWFCGLYPRRQHWLLAVGFVLLGVVLEFLQGSLTLTRARDWHDAVANTSGIAAGFLLGGFGLANWARRLEAWLTARR